MTWCKPLNGDPGTAHDGRVVSRAVYRVRVEGLCSGEMQQMGGLHERILRAGGCEGPKVKHVVGNLRKVVVGGQSVDAAGVLGGIWDEVGGCVTEFFGFRRGFARRMSLRDGNT